MKSRSRSYMGPKHGLHCHQPARWSQIAILWGPHGPIGPGEPHVGPINLAIRDGVQYDFYLRSFFSNWQIKTISFKMADGILLSSATLQPLIVRPEWHRAVIWTNAGILLIEPIGTTFNEILIEMHTLSFRKMHLKMSSAKWRSFCLGLDVLINKVVKSVMDVSLRWNLQDWFQIITVSLSVHLS